MKGALVVHPGRGDGGLTAAVRPNADFLAHYKQERCTREAPLWEELKPGRFAACHFARELELGGVDEFE